MPKSQSLDEFIAKKAAEFADHVKGAAALADTEEEIRIDVENQLAFIKKEAGIDFEHIQGKHEFTVAKGRIDSVYSRVIIEYKNPSDPGACIGPKLDSPGTKKVVEQIKLRFRGLHGEQGHPLNSLFGVGLDGNRFVFVRYRDNKWDPLEPEDLNKHSAARFLWALYNLGQAGKPFRPEYLASDFGAAEGSIAIEGIHTLYNAIAITVHPKAQTFFKQWKILFGEVCGYDVDNPSDKVKKLAEFYHLPSKALKPAEMLFALHTYYALFMKLLASQIVAFFHKLPAPLKAMLSAGTSAKLKRELEELEAGSIFRHLNINNFLEGDLFAWYTAVWSDPVESAVRRMVAKLDEYLPGTLSEDPVTSRDLLKKLYHQLFPKSVRHDLGEYYTPDWLAEHVLNEVGYVGDPDKRLLDPACGSGTFLVMAINRIKAWFEEHRDSCPYDEGDLCKRMLANVIGFDLNPLAIMAARTNYLMAIRELVSHAGSVEIPVYLCDSIMTPSEYGGLFAAGVGKSKELKTAAATFIIPTEVATNRDDVTKYSDQLKSCVHNGYSPAEFLVRCRDEGLPVQADELHTDLFNELVKLKKEDRNSVWAQIIKNAFAPLFVGQVDYVAGNPPWVNWESLPEEYRDSLKPLWQQYGLFTLSGSAGRLGGGKKDLSMLFVYACVDNYLRPEGRLGFVITQTVFKTKGAGDGFRRLQFGCEGKRVVLKPIAVHDLCRMQVFEGATNRTAVFVCEKSRRRFSYPVSYFLWRGPSRVGQEQPLEAVSTAVHLTKLQAVPIEAGNDGSPWLTVSKLSLAGVQKIVGSGEYTAYEGANTGGLNGCYLIRVLERRKDGQVLIENLHDIGKIKLHRTQATIEHDLVYPLLRGRDIRPWKATPSMHIILAQDPVRSAGIPETEMKRKHAKTFAYLKRFEGDEARPLRGTLRGRALFKKYFKPSDPFYSMYNVGPYVLARWKVVWRDMGSEIQVAVVGASDGKAVCPEHHVMAVPLDNEAEAHYLCGLLMSSPVQLLVAGYTTSTGISTHVLDHVSVPKYSPRDRTHAQIADLSRRCHEAVAAEGSRELAGLQAEIDTAAAKLWRLTNKEVTAIQGDIKLNKELEVAAPEDDE